MIGVPSTNWFANCTTTTFPSAAVYVVLPETVDMKRTKLPLPSTNTLSVKTPSETTSTVIPHTLTSSNVSEKRSWKIWGGAATARRR